MALNPGAINNYAGRSLARSYWGESLDGVKLGTIEMKLLKLFQLIPSLKGEPQSQFDYAIMTTAEDILDYCTMFHDVKKCIQIPFFRKKIKAIRSLKGSNYLTTKPYPQYLVK